MDAALDYKKLYGPKSESWKLTENDAQTLTSSKLAKALAIDLPFTRLEAAKKCLDRLILAQRLRVEACSNQDESNTLSAVMLTAMLPEIQTLEALEKESMLHSTVVRQVEELNKKHAYVYNAMRQEQHKNIVKFLKDCRTEKESLVRDSLYEKAKLLSRVKKVGISNDLSSEDILKRMLQNAGGAFKDVEGKLSQMQGKHKDSLQRLPNIECVICFMKFSLKRKRAYLEPCGHSSACVDCTTQEWKRTKTCPLCKAVVQKPIAVPLKLYF